MAHPDRKEIKVHQDSREAVAWLSLDPQESEVNVDQPDLTDPEERTTFPEVTKSPRSKKAAQELLDQREKRETSDAMDHQDKRVLQESKETLAPRENQACEDHEDQAAETVSRGIAERRGTRVNAEPTDQSD